MNIKNFILSALMIVGISASAQEASPLAQKGKEVINVVDKATGDRTIVYKDVVIGGLSGGGDVDVLTSVVYDKTGKVKSQKTAAFFVKYPIGYNKPVSSTATESTSISDLQIEPSLKDEFIQLVTDMLHTDPILAYEGVENLFDMHVRITTNLDSPYISFYNTLNGVRVDLKRMEAVEILRDSL